MMNVQSNQRATDITIIPPFEIPYNRILSGQINNRWPTHISSDGRTRWKSSENSKAEANETSQVIIDPSMKEVTTVKQIDWMNCTTTIFLLSELNTMERCLRRYS